MTTPKARVAVIDDDAMLRRLLGHQIGSAFGAEVVELGDGRSALEAIDGTFDVVCLDLGLGDVSGLDVLRHLRARGFTAPVIVVTAERDVEVAVAAMRAGAYDFVTKPVDRDRLTQILGRALERQRLVAEVSALQSVLSAKQDRPRMVGRSPATMEVLRQIDRIRDSDVSVCILGESGTGKEVAARTIHETSRRARGPFVAVNCGAIPASLQESELFGHERGAFTGAVAQHIGRFEQASKGTLLLDEVGEMSPSTQAALLRVLQERTIRRVGGHADLAVDVRMVCATHRDLEAEVRAGRFREDLYFRLVVYPVRLLPLRERLEDIPALVSHLLDRLSTDAGRKVDRVDADAMDALLRYRWPGNVRELQNVLHRAMLACDGSELSVSHLPREVAASTLPALPPDARPTEGGPAKLPTLCLSELEKRAIAEALAQCGGNIDQAAKVLGMGRATLYRRLATLGYS